MIVAQIKYRFFVVAFFCFCLLQKFKAKNLIINRFYNKINQEPSQEDLTLFLDSFGLPIFWSKQKNNSY